MAELGLPKVKADGFSFEPALDSNSLRIEFTGNGDMTAIAPLADYLKQVHDEAQRLNVSDVTCDFRKLMFMNSSCFKAFVVWIDTVKNAGRRYKIHFLTDPSMHWQRRSLEALRRLAIEIVSIDAQSPASAE